MGMDNQLQLEHDIHFTYKEHPDTTSLCQGDVLEKTDELIEILKRVHPDFCNDECKFFMVLTQSCDLVRRDGKKCKTDFITLAPVRGYDDFLAETLLKGKLAKCYSGFLFVNDKSKMRISQLIERLYNNTEPEYFFLYKEDSLDFSKSMICSLRETVSLKSELHYEQCLNAKKLELSEEFKAKLGWLIGNLYSRVGTTDWESIMTSKQKNKMIEDDIHSMCIAGSNEQIRELKKFLKNENIVFNSRDEAINYLSSIAIKSKYDQVMDLIESIFMNGYKKIKAEDKEMLLNAIKSSSRIRNLIE